MSSEPKYLVEFLSNHTKAMMTLEQIKIFKDKIIVLREIKQKPDVVKK